MTLQDLIEDKKGVFVLYWYDREDNLVSRMCYPEVINQRTVYLLRENIDTMADRNLFCLVFEDLTSDKIYVYNKGALINGDIVVIESDDFSVSESDKRMFYRYAISSDLMLMNRHHHEKVTLNNISYTGVNIFTNTELKMGEEIMLYDPGEIIPVYIPGKVVYIDGKGNYGVMVCGNYDHINRIVVPKII
ncbi:MAG: PilZ domain-containing protein [Lachnospiraceae bacterium]|nr:PilZ domain-containing protein [Lachnospiraceae bacterium]